MSDEQDKNDERSQVCTLVRERYSRSSKATADIRSIWEQCRLFYRGDQFITNQGGAWRAPTDSPDWRVRLVTNKLIANVESAIATFLSSDPIITATAGTDEETDRKAAQISESIIYYLWQHLDIQDDKLKELLLWMKVCGDAFIHVKWDKTLGEQIIPDPMALSHEQENETAGDLVVDVLDPASVSVEPGAIRIKDAAWAIVTRSMLRSDVERIYDTDLDEEEGSEESYDDSDVYRASFLENQGSSKERVIVHIMYEKPCKKFPDGRVVHSTEDQELRVEGALLLGEYPIFQFTDISIPGELFGTSSVSQAIPSQVGYNRLRSQIIENRNLMGQPKWMAPEGSVPDGYISDEPGEIIEYDMIASHGIKPDQARVHQTSQVALQELGLFGDEINDSMSRHEPSQGKGSSGITSGRHALASREADNSRTLPSMKLFQKRLAEMARMMLILLKRYMPQERVATIVGKTREDEVIRFTGSDISDACNIRFDIASQTPWNRDGLRESAIWMFSQGLIDQAQILDVLQFPSVRSVYQPELIHKTNARIENELLREGQTISPMPTDNHAVHMKEHAEELNNPEIRVMLIEDRQRFQQEHQAVQAGQMHPTQAQPSMAQAFFDHMEQHREAIPAPQSPPAEARVNISSADLPPQLSAAVAQTAVPDVGGPGQEKKQEEQGGGSPIGTPTGLHLSGEQFGDGPGESGVSQEEMNVDVQ